MGVCVELESEPDIISIWERECISAPTTSCGEYVSAPISALLDGANLCDASYLRFPTQSFAAAVDPAAALRSQLVDPRDSNVLGINGAFRQSATEEFFNPTNATPPFLQVFHPDFLQILGPSATIRAVAANATFAFAHEAPIWNPGTDEVFFASNDGGMFGMSDIDHNNQVAKISLKDVAAAIRASGRDIAPVNVTVTKVRI